MPGNAYWSMGMRCAGQSFKNPRAVTTESARTSAAKSPKAQLQRLPLPSNRAAWGVIMDGPWNKRCSGQTDRCHTHTYARLAQTPLRIK